MITLQQPAKFEHWSDTKRLHVKGVLVLSGNYTTGGDTLSFAVNNPTIKTGSFAPIFCIINNTTAYQLKWVQGTTLNNGLVKIFDLGTGKELVSGPYPAALLADPDIRVYTVWKKYVDLG